MPCGTSNNGQQKALLQQWKTLLDAVPAMVFFKDTENRFLEVNRAYAEAVGLSKEEIIGRAVGDFLSDARRVDAYWQDDREVIESGRPKRNITALHLTDPRRWLRTEKLPVRDQDNRIIGVVGLSVDISDLKRTERQLDLRIRQQEAIAAIGQHALSGIEPGQLFEEAAALVCRTLEVDCCQVLKSLGDGNRCIPLAQAGGAEDFPGGAPCKDGENLQFLCPLRLKRPLVIRNLQAQQRLCRAFPGLEGRGVTSSLIVTIGSKNKPFGVLASHSIPPRRFCRADRDFVRGAAHMLALAVEQVQARDAIRRSAEQLEDLTAKLIEAQEKERQRIFLALHDELGQSLALLKMRVRAVQMRLDPGQADLGADCRQILGDISAVIDNVRRLCHDLTPAALEDIGLNAALQWLCEDFARHFGFHLVVGLDKVDHIFRRDAQLLIYRIFQEALTNVRKHAAATHVRVTLSRHGATVVCEVLDNGLGMPGGHQPKRRFPGDGLGLAAMGERARMLGGRLEVDTSSNGGTAIRVTIPLDPEPETR